MWHDQPSCIEYRQFTSSNILQQKTLTFSIIPLFSSPVHFPPAPLEQRSVQFTHGCHVIVQLGGSGEYSKHAAVTFGFIAPRYIYSEMAPLIILLRGPLVILRQSTLQSITIGRRFA